MSAIAPAVMPAVQSGVGSAVGMPCMGDALASVKYDFTNSISAVRLKSGSSSFARNSVAWAQAYDESTGNLVWTQMSANVPCFHGLRWTGTAWTPYKTDGTLIPAATRRGLRLQSFALTNSLPNSRDFSTWASSLGTPTIAQDSVGFDGTANSASTITDDSASLEGKYQDITIPADTNTHTYRIRIKADSDTSRFPFFGCQTIGVSRTSFWHLNSQTGAYTARGANHASAKADVYRDGDFWVCLASVQNDGTSVAFRAYAIPADGTVFGTTDATATGSAVFDQCEIFLNKTIEEVKYAEPIVTTGAAATRLADAFVPGVISGNWDQNVGVALVGWEPFTSNTDMTGDVGIVNIDTDATGPLYADGTNNTIEAFDGTNTASLADTWSAAALTHVAVRWNSTTSKQQVIVDQTAGTEATYDGAYATTGTDILVAQGCNYPVILRYLEIYDKDKGANWITGRQGSLAP